MAEVLAHEIRSSNPPEVAIANVAKMAPDFARMGYKLESHAGTSLTVVRAKASLLWLVPFLVGLLWAASRSGDPATDPATNGLVFWACMGIAIACGLLVKRRQRVTFTARPDGEGSIILATGEATDQMRAYVLAINTAAPDGGQRATVTRE